MSGETGSDQRVGSGGHLRAPGLGVAPPLQRAGAVAFSSGRGVPSSPPTTPRNVRCYDLLAGEPVVRFERHPAQVRAVACSVRTAGRLRVGGRGRPDGCLAVAKLPLVPGPGCRRDRERLQSPGGRGSTPTRSWGVGSQCRWAEKFWRQVRRRQAGRPDDSRPGALRPGAVPVRIADLSPDGRTAVAAADWHKACFRGGQVATGRPAGPRAPAARVEKVGFDPGGQSFYFLTAEPVAGKGRLPVVAARAGPGPPRMGSRSWPPLPDAMYVAIRPPAGDLVLLGQRAGHPTGFRAAATGYSSAHSPSPPGRPSTRRPRSTRPGHFRGDRVAGRSAGLVGPGRATQSPGRSPTRTRSTSWRSGRGVGGVLAAARRLDGTVGFCRIAGPGLPAGPGVAVSGYRSCRWPSMRPAAGW